MPRNRDVIESDLKACARAIAAAERLGAKRNRLWREAADAGFTAVEIGDIFGVEAQTVRWNLRREGDQAPDLSRSLHRNRARAS